MKILLMGNPNVGKSVVFSRLTGARVIASNYPGSTVGYSSGFMRTGGRQAEVIDVPGTYTLEPTNEAEKVAAEMVQDGDVVINVVNATNLERNLYLTLQLLEKDIPVIVALNIWDETKHLGIKIDFKKLEQRLGVPVVPTTATTGEGIKDLVERLPRATTPHMPPRNRHERWAVIGDIVAEVQQITHRHHTWRDRLEDASVKPLAGALMAAGILTGAFFAVRAMGEGLINYALNPLFENLWLPLVMKASSALGGSGLLHDIMVGKLIDGGVDFVQSMGLMTTGLYVPFAMVLPYIIPFYLVLGFLEDVGYLPRLAVLMDTLMHRIGLHGYAIIPAMLGLGCNVPAILSTRLLESKRERFIAATLISIAVPCTAAQAMIFGLVGARGGQYVAIVYGTLLAIWVIMGLILNRTVKGFSPELLIEIPPYRLPSGRSIAKKLWMRVHGFILEAIPIILAAVAAINALYVVGAFDAAANVTAPVITGLLGLPKEAIVALSIGFLRKDVALGMMAPLMLTTKQLMVSSVVLSAFFPCIATFVVLLRELGGKSMLKAVGIMISVAFITGGLMNLAL